MRRSLVLAGAVLLIPGCNKSAPAPSNTTAVAEPAAPANREVVATAALPDAPLGMKPGRWEHTSEVLDAQGQGMPPQALAMMKGEPHTVATCVTPQQAKTGVRELMQAGGQTHCSFDKYESAGGKISTEMSCTMPHGKMVSKATGSYTDTSYEVTGEGTTSSGPMTMTMKTRSSGRWIGECKGDESGKMMGKPNARFPRNR